MKYVVGIFMLVLLPFAFGLAVMSEAFDRLIDWMNGTMDRVGL